MKTLDYTVVHPNGDVERVRVPVLFSPQEFAKKLRHSLVFLHVRKGWSVTVDQILTGGPGTAHGATTVFVDSQTDASYQVPMAPKTDLEAHRLWLTYIAPHRQRIVA